MASLDVDDVTMNNPTTIARLTEYVQKYPDKLIGLIERFELYKFDNEVLQRNYIPIKKEPLVEISEGYYTIQQGDTLYSLSKKFKLTVEELQKINNLSSSTISLGQTIKIK